MNDGTQARNGEHLIQFYGVDEARLVREVGAFLGDSLARNGAAIVVAAEPLRSAVLADLRTRIGNDPIQDGRLVQLDAEETLATFMRDGDPDPALFEASVGERTRELAARYGPLKAYGEMVGCLWQKRAFGAALALEDLWNRLMEEVRFDLFCGYPIDVLSDDFQMPSVRMVLDAHSRMVPALSPAFEKAIRRAMDEVLGYQTLPTAVVGGESTILRLRSAMPRYADEIITRAREYEKASA